MINWQFLAFTIFVAVAIYLHFFLAHRHWKRVKGERRFEIRWDYIKTEDYLGHSFRDKVKEWLQLPADLSNDERIISKDSERICVTGTRNYPAGSTCDDILIIEGDFQCGPLCTFTREIYVKGNCSIGAGSRLQAVAVDGQLTLEPRVTVVRWVDSAGAIRVGAGSTIQARVTSATKVHLEPGSRVASVYAPEVFTSRRSGGFESAAPPAESSLIEIFPPSVPFLPESFARAGFDRDRLSELTGDCWLYRGGLVLRAPVKLTSNLVVKGSLAVSRGSILNGDVKTEGELRLVQGCACYGNLVAARDVHMEASSHFHGIIHAGRRLWLRRGVRGYAKGQTVAAYAAESIYVEEDVLIRGKLAAGAFVIAISSESRAGANEKHE